MISEAIYEEVAERIKDSYAISTTYDRVVADDEQGLDMSVLNQGIITHPLVSPLLGKLFSNLDKGANQKTQEQGSLNDQNDHEGGRHPRIVY